MAGVDSAASQAAAGGQAAVGWNADLVKEMSISVLLFLVVLTVLAVILMWRNKAGPDHIVKVCTIIAVIGVAAVLLIAGYSNEQLTPVIGLFGAIAGYVLAKDTKTPPQDPPPGNKP
jgi:heme/copper-type cytochrome/quinol oxidase subunit 4